VGLNRPPGARRERPGHPRGFRACFGSVCGSPGLRQQSLGAPGGGQKAFPGGCAPLPGARGEKMPGTARAPKKRKSLRRDSSANWVRFGSPRGVLLEPFWRHFRTSVRKVRPSRNIVFYHVSWGSGSRGDARRTPEEASKSRARKRRPKKRRARARLCRQNGPFWPP